MKKLFIDIDGIVRDIHIPAMKKPAQVWAVKIKGVSFVDYVTKHIDEILPNCKKAEYYDVVKEWIGLASYVNLEFLSCQPESWIPYTEKWLHEHFPGMPYQFVGTPEEKLGIVRKNNAWLIDDYPNFSDYSKVIIADKPYNQKSKGNVRVRDKEEFMYILLQCYTNDMIWMPRLCHQIAKSKGWWITDRNDGELLALMHSEISEALEALRQSDDTKNNVTEELADCCIRIFDYCAARKLNLQEAIVQKMLKNMSRPWRHNKKF